jgi:hypothetical protein
MVCLLQMLSRSLHRHTSLLLHFFPLTVLHLHAITCTSRQLSPRSMYINQIEILFPPLFLCAGDRELSPIFTFCLLNLLTRLYMVRTLNG